MSSPRTRSSLILWLSLQTIVSEQLPLWTPSPQRSICQKKVSLTLKELRIRGLYRVLMWACREVVAATLARAPTQSASLRGRTRSCPVGRARGHSVAPTAPVCFRHSLDMALQSGVGVDKVLDTGRGGNPKGCCLTDPETSGLKSKDGAKSIFGGSIHNEL